MPHLGTRILGIHTTNDQPVHADTRSFIYADDWCIASQGNDFNNIEASLMSALSTMTTYYDTNQLRANPSKTQVCDFHLRNREAKRELNVMWNGTRKLANSKWGCKASTLSSSCLALCYSAAEYACPVWARSTHARKLNPALHDCCRIISGCLKPTNLDSVYLQYRPSTHQDDCCIPHGTHTPNDRRQTPTIPSTTSC